MRFENGVVSFLCWNSWVPLTCAYLLPTRGLLLPCQVLLAQTRLRVLRVKRHHPKGVLGGEFLWLEEVQISGAGEGAGATVRAELAGGVVYLLLDGRHRDEEGTRDLRVGHARSDEPKHLRLPGAESGGVGLWGGRLGRCRVVKGVFDGLLRRHRPTLRPGRLPCCIVYLRARRHP